MEVTHASAAPINSSNNMKHNSRDLLPDILPCAPIHTDEEALTIQRK